MKPEQKPFGLSTASPLYALRMIRGLLTDVVIEPVVKEECAVCPPSNVGRQVGIVVPVVMEGLLNGKPATEVALVLRVEREGRIFAVARDEDFATASCHHYAHTAFVAFGKQGE